MNWKRDVVDDQNGSDTGSRALENIGLSSTHVQVQNLPRDFRFFFFAKARFLLSTRQSDGKRWQLFFCVRVRTQNPRSALIINIPGGYREVCMRQEENVRFSFSTESSVALSCCMRIRTALIITFHACRQRGAGWLTGCGETDSQQAKRRQHLHNPSLPYKQTT